MCLLLAAACLLGRAAASPAEATFNFTYGYNPAAITVEAVNYTDESGTALRVRLSLQDMPEHKHTLQFQPQSFNQLHLSTQAEVCVTLAGILCT